MTPKMVNEAEYVNTDGVHANVVVDTTTFALDTKAIDTADGTEEPNKNTSTCRNNQQGADGIRTTKAKHGEEKAASIPDTWNEMVTESPTVKGPGLGVVVPNEPVICSNVELGVGVGVEAGVDVGVEVGVEVGVGVGPGVRLG